MTEHRSSTGHPPANAASRIAVFAREPRLGQVKSRLASELGAEEALAIYRAMLARVGSLLESGNLPDWDLWVTSKTSHEDFVSICNKKNIYLQEGKDLGAKMAQAFQQTLQDTRVRHLVLIGTDCPALTEAYLEQAFAALESGVDVVLGPAEDGGYVLIGMGRALSEVFEDIPWGTAEVLMRTVQALETRGLRYALLETLWDVDRPEDLARLVELQPPLAWSAAE